MEEKSDNRQILLEKDDICFKRVTYLQKFKNWEKMADQLYFWTNKIYILPMNGLVWWLHKCL